MKMEALYQAGIFSVAGMAVMSVSMIIPVLPDIERAFHVSPTDASLVVMAYTLPGIVIALICGVLADVWGRKPLLIPGILCFSIGGALCAMSQSFEELLVFRALQGIGGGTTGVMYATLIADRYQGADLTKMMGRVMAVISLGTAVFPLVGGLLGEIDWYVPFLLTAAGLLVVPIFLYLPLRPGAQNFNYKRYLIQTRDSLMGNNVLLLFLVIFLGYSIYYGPLTYFPSMAHERFEVSSSRIGAVLAVGSLSGAVIAMSLGRLSALFSLRNLLLIAGLAYAVSQAVMLFMPALWWYMLPLFIAGVGQGLCVPIVNRSVASSAPADNRAALLAVNGSVFRLSQTCAPVLYGLGWTFFGWRGPYAIGLGVAVIFILLIFFFYGRADRKRQEDLKGEGNVLPH